MLMLSIMVLSGCDYSLGPHGIDKYKYSNIQSIKENISVDDYSWEVYETNRDGKDASELIFKNSSKYDLLRVDMTFKERKSNSTASDYYVGGRSDDMYIPSNSSSDSILLNVSNSYDSVLYAPDGYATKEQFVKTEPVSLMMYIVDDEEYLYYVVYHFENKKWEVREETEKINSWPSDGLPALIPKIEGKISKSMNGVAREKTDKYNKQSWDITVYGINEEEYNSYIREVKKLGFENNIDEYNNNDYRSFRAFNSKDDEVYIFYKVGGTIEISIRSYEYIK